MPQISVIVPVYKVENFIRRCVDSILNQTYTDFELILVDDGSPDNCGKICDEYAEKGKRIVVIHQENGGLSAARNAGIDWAFENSNSEWITFIDSDDWVHKDYLRFLFDTATENGVNISVCSYKEVEEYESDDEIGENSTVVSPEELWLSNRVNATVAWGKLYRKSLWKKFRYPVGKLEEDEFTTYKLLFDCVNVAYLKKELYYYFQNKKSIMHNWSIRNLDSIVAYEDQMTFFASKSNNLIKASIVLYINELYYHICEMKYNGYVSTTEYSCLINKMRNMLLKKGKKYGFSVKNNKNMYLIAFPYEMCVYEWFRKRIKHLKQRIK